MDEHEKAAELEAVKEVKEEEVRAQIIEEFGFDEVDDAERIEKLVKKEVGSRQKLSQAIGQKIKYRTEAETLKQTPPKKEEPQAPKVPAPEDVDKLVDAKLQQRDLDAMEYPDDLKKEIKRIADIQGVTVRQAARDPYIVAKIDAYEKQQKADEAAITRTNRSSGKKSFSEVPPEVDMSTAEGRKEYDEWVTWAKKNL